MTEAYASIELNMRYYGGFLNKTLVEGAQIPFNFEFLMNIRRDSKATVYEGVIWHWLNNMPKRTGIQANWVVSIIL